MTDDLIRVVLVDDQALFRSGLAATIGQQADMAVVGQAGDGAAALDVIRRTEPDVVLLDMRMPGWNGVETCRRLFAPEEAARRRRPLRVIVLTTFDLDEDAATAIRYGASGFLLKDVTPDFLTAAIRAVRDGNAVIAPDDIGALVAGSYRSSVPVPAAFTTLTTKEREIFAAVARGLSNAEIGGTVHLSESTIKTHVGNILRKLGLRDRVQLVVYAADHGLR